VVVLSRLLVVVVGYIAAAGRLVVVVGSPVVFAGGRVFVMGRFVALGRSWSDETWRRS